MEIDYDKLADALAVRINQRRKDCDCIYDVSPKVHDSHHRMMESLAKTFERIENIQWDLLKRLATMTLYGVVAVFLVGLSFKMGWIKP